MVSEELLQQAVQRRVERFHPERIILLGSQAHGDPRNDVDLLGGCPLKAPQHEMAYEIYQSLADMPFAKDGVLLSPEQHADDLAGVNTLSAIADREGRVLYASGFPNEMIPQ